MKNSFLIYFLMSIVVTLNAQFEDPDTYLRGEQKVPQVLLVGTFHFGYPGLDGHKTKDENKLDILSDQRQKELDDLLAYLKKFKPTKIMVESGSNTGYLMHRMREWSAGKETLKRDERDQIGIRLCHKMNLDTIYGVDAASLQSELWKSDSTSFKKLFGEKFSDKAESTNPFNQRYWDWYERDDELAYKTELLDYFKYTNEDKYIKRMHGHYILSDQYSDYDGMDGWFLLNWYSRNLRIIKNIQNVETSPDDRILVLFGSGHLAILMQQFEASPEYELIRFNTLD